MSELEKYIQSYFAVDRNEISKISACFQSKSIKKGDYFLKTGRDSHQLGFIQSGILREFLLVDGREITKWISTQGYFVVDLSSFLFGQSARWNIQALTDAELFVIDRKDYQNLGQSIEGWGKLEKLFIARCFTVLEDRIVSQLSLTAEERYKQFFQFNPELFNLVPLQYIASMLGMTPETLSRMRKKVI